jgi:hypothetical protein
VYGSTVGVGLVALTNLIVNSGTDGLEAAIVDWKKFRPEAAKTSMSAIERIFFGGIIISYRFVWQLKGSYTDSLTKPGQQMLTTAVNSLRIWLSV